MDGLARCQDLIAAAERHRFRGEPEAAFEACRAALQGEGMTWKQALHVSGILAALHQNALAADIQTRVIAQIGQTVSAHPDNVEVLRNAGLAYASLRDVETATALLGRAFDRNPTDVNLGLRLSSLLLSAGNADAALAHWQPHVDRMEDPGFVLIRLAQAFAHYGLRDRAEALLARARPHCGEELLATAEIVTAALRGEDVEVDQRAMAIGIFDAFSDSYDDVLEGLGNNGPQLAARAIAEAGLPADGGREVLDAGCGTGLCAPYLRPYAKVLHGADISVGMLEGARDKGEYDFLTRTDLADPATYPGGWFDLIVSNDTLDYFGALDAVLVTLFTTIAPRGWLVFTVEEAVEITPETGYAITPAGRYVHSEAYLRGALASAGFAVPKVVLRDTLRKEFDRPVAGLAIAVQRPE